MKFFKDFGQGFVYFFKSLEVIFTRGLWPYLFYPLIVSGLLVGLMIWAGMELTEYLSDYLQSKFDSAVNTYEFLSFFKSLKLGFLSSIIAWIISIIIGFFTSRMFKYFVLAILSPMLALASEKTEEKLTGNEFPFNFGQLLLDIFRGIGITIRNLLIEYFFVFMGFFLLLIPVLGPFLFLIYGFFLTILGYYYIGFSMLDYCCERHKMNIGQSTRFIRSNKGFAVGVGLIYSAFFWLPTHFFTIIAMMFAPLMAAVGSSMYVVDLHKKEEEAKLKQQQIDSQKI